MRGECCDLFYKTWSLFFCFSFHQKEHQVLLRPTLGHPNNKPQLEKLQASELSRQKEDNKAIVDYQRIMTECSNLTAKNFVAELIESTTTLLSHFDVALTLDDIIVGGLNLI